MSKYTPNIITGIIKKDNISLVENSIHQLKYKDNIETALADEIDILRDKK